MTPEQRKQFKERLERNREVAQNKATMPVTNLTLAAIVDDLLEVVAALLDEKKGTDVDNVES